MKILIEVPSELIQQMQCDSKAVNGRELTERELLKIIRDYFDHLIGVDNDDVSYCYDEYVNAYTDNAGFHPVLTNKRIVKR